MSVTFSLLSFSLFFNLVAFASHFARCDQANDSAPLSTKTAYSVLCICISEYYTTNHIK